MCDRLAREEGCGFVSANTTNFRLGFDGREAVFKVDAKVFNARAKDLEEFNDGACRGLCGAMGGKDGILREVALIC